MLLFIYLFFGLLFGPGFLDWHLSGTLHDISAYGFLFFAGLELSLRDVRAYFASSAKVAWGAFSLPFAVGLLFSVFSETMNDWRGHTVVAIALAISALPVVVQILKDLKLYHTRMGHLIVTSATLCDLVAWMAFAVLIPTQHRGAWLESHFPLFFFFAGIFAAGYVERSPKLGKWGHILSAYFFAPIFFVGIGMKIDFFKSFDGKQFFIITTLAVVSKTLGTYFAAKSSGLNKKDSLLAGVVLNARGAMEILFCSMALKMGMINEVFFTSLVLMAVLTSLMAVPLVKLIGWNE